MLVKKLEVPHHTLLNLFSENKLLYDKLINYFSLQCDVHQLPRLDTVFRKLLDTRIKICETRISKESSYVDAMFDRETNIVKLFMNLNKLSTSRVASQYLNYLFTKLSFGVIYYYLMSNKVQIDKDLRHALTTYLYSFWYVTIGQKGGLLTRNKQDIVLFELLTKKYIMDTVTSSVNATPWVDVEKELVNVDPLVMNTVMSECKMKSIDSLEKLSEAFIKFGLLDENKDLVNDIIQRSIHMDKTLYYIERLKPALAFIFTINFDSNGLFEDTLRKFNPDAVKHIKTLLYKQLG